MVKYQIKLRTPDELSEQEIRAAQEEHGDIQSSWLFYDNGKRALIKRVNNGRDPDPGIAKPLDSRNTTPQNIKTSLKIINDDIKSVNSRVELKVIADYFKVKLTGDYM